MALREGKKPAAIPTKTEKPTAATESHIGILDKSPGISGINRLARNRLMRNEIP